ncbi:MAG: Na(+)/H(+) antiporter NhaA [Pseudomonadota bacterium]|jgi:NhaA family Na+:H+ antiporter
MTPSDPSRNYPLEPLFGRILSPFERFLKRTTSGGLVLMGTTALVLLGCAVWGAEGLAHFWEQYFQIGLVAGGWRLSLHHWVNDGLMALFFLLVGLELKREILVGELSSWQDAALPVVAAVGGMLVPAGLYLLFNAGTPAASGWGVPMATDIAFAIGILVLLAWRIPKNLIIFLTALAIADDLGAVLVIALFYTAQIDTGALLVAAGIGLALLLCNRGGIRHPLPYVLLGLLLWAAILESGIHATVAGILLATAIPTRAAAEPAAFYRRLGQMLEHFRLESAAGDDPLRNHGLATVSAEIEHMATAVQSPLQRIEHALSPWVVFLVIPIFAIANAGIDLAAVPWSAALGQPVTLGVVAGLVVGKFVGISLFSWVAVRLGLGRLPQGVSWRQLCGAAWLGGIGFTMSLFISQLAFSDPLLAEQAKLGILLSSLLAALIGLGWLLLSAQEKSHD